FMVDNGPVPLTSVYDPGYPLQANAEWSYNPSTTPTSAGGVTLGPGLSYIVYPTASDKMPLYGADFEDPNTHYANPNGVVMWSCSLLPSMSYGRATRRPRPQLRSAASALPPTNRTLLTLPPGVLPDSLAAKRRSRSAA